MRKLSDLGPQLRQASGFAFCNTSKHDSSWPSRRDGLRLSPIELGVEGDGKGNVEFFTEHAEVSV